MFCSAFCDEDVIIQKQEKHEHESSARHEMYTEQRKEMMNKQVTNIHQSKQEQTVSMTSSEAREWQAIAKKEKSYAEYAENSHFSMVSFFTSGKKDES